MEKEIKEKVHPITGEILSINDYIKYKVIELYEQNIKLCSKIYKEEKNSGGKIRQIMGDTVEMILKLILNELKNYYNKNGKVVKGKNDEIKIFSENGYIKVSVDVHTHIEEINIYSECKTYLDKCYLDRANSDLQHFKKQNSNNICIIVSLENAVKLEAENYFLDQKNIDKIFYLVDGKRNSSKQIWNEGFFKKINEKSLNDLIKYLENLIDY